MTGQKHDLFSVIAPEFVQRLNEQFRSVGLDHKDINEGRLQDYVHELVRQGDAPVPQECLE